MKWFKTRKDKKIEELQAEIARKDKAIAERDRAMMWQNTFQVKRLYPQVLKFAKRIQTRYVGEIPDIERIKAEMTEEIARNIIPYITWRLERIPCNEPFAEYAELYGRICVAKEDGEGE